MGFTEAELKIIWGKINGFQLSKESRAFRKTVRNELIEKISTQPDKGFGELMRITNELDEGTSGNLFSDWGRKHIDNGGLGEKQIRFNKTINGKTQVKTIKPDNIVEHTADIALSEFKHYRIPDKLSQREIEQLQEYYDLFGKPAVYGRKGLKLFCGAGAISLLQS